MKYILQLFLIEMSTIAIAQDITTIPYQTSIEELSENVTLLFYDINGRPVYYEEFRPSEGIIQRDVSIL